MTDVEANVLRDIATQEENTLAKIQSQNVLHLVYGDTFPVIIDDEEIYLRQMQKPQEDSKSTFAYDLHIYPNPANEVVEIKLGNSEEYLDQIVMMNSFGKAVLQQKVNATVNSFGLNTASLSSGLYLVKVTFRELI